MRYTIHLKFGHDFLPMVNCPDLEKVAQYLKNDEAGDGFRVFDNTRNQWVEPERVLLACVLLGD